MDRTVSPICRSVSRSWEFRWGPLGSLGDIERPFKWARGGPEVRKRPGRVGNPMGSATHLCPTAFRLALAGAGARRGRRRISKSAPSAAAARDTESIVMVGSVESRSE